MVPLNRIAFFVRWSHPSFSEIPVFGLELRQLSVDWRVACAFEPASHHALIPLRIPATRPTDIRQCYLAHCQLGGQPYFFKQLANGRDAHVR
jgi:hypothetical protein